MSELKSYDLVDIQDYRGEVYLKPDVDKKIAELNRKLTEKGHPPRFSDPEDYMAECLRNRRTPISLTETLRDRHRDEEILRSLDLMPHSRPHTKMAEDFERDLFVTMRIWHVSKVYVVQETTTDENGIPRWDLWFQRDRPEGKECTEHDFQNLLDMSDAEFSHLPYSPNKYVVEEWRKEMKEGK
jgi:hypothetical protein